MDRSAHTLRNADSRIKFTEEKGNMESMLDQNHIRRLRVLALKLGGWT